MLSVKYNNTHNNNKALNFASLSAVMVEIKIVLIKFRVQLVLKHTHTHKLTCTYEQQTVPAGKSGNHHGKTYRIEMRKCDVIQI